MSDLERFVKAQDPVWEQVRRELAEGEKRSHWMWFVFPQLRGLGRSATAQYYGIADLAEARAYARHPVLGPRLVEAARLVLSHPEKTAEEIFGPVDAMKLRSSATLFAHAAPDPAPFRRILDTFFHGEPCTLTEAMLREAG
jgi:uncharacterized protein (DUF1810 family)